MFLIHVAGELLLLQWSAKSNLIFSLSSVQSLAFGVSVRLLKIHCMLYKQKKYLHIRGLTLNSRLWTPLCDSPRRRSKSCSKGGRTWMNSRLQRAMYACVLRIWMNDPKKSLLEFYRRYWKRCNDWLQNKNSRWVATGIPLSIQVIPVWNKDECYFTISPAVFLRIPA